MWYFIGDIETTSEYRKKDSMTQNTGDQVPNFSVVGFEPDTASNQLALPGVHALAISACVSGSYNPSTNQICVVFPLIGRICFTSPVHIPVGGEIKVCGITCGTFIPTGVKATVYVNNVAVGTIVIWGHC
jgi:hypothetical protein